MAWSARHTSVVSAHCRQAGLQIDLTFGRGAHNGTVKAWFMFSHATSYSQLSWSLIGRAISVHLQTNNWSEYSTQHACLTYGHAVLNSHRVMPGGTYYITPQPWLPFAYIRWIITGWSRSLSAFANKQIIALSSNVLGYRFTGLHGHELFITLQWISLGPSTPTPEPQPPDVLS